MESYSDTLPELDKVKQTLQEVVQRELDALNIRIDRVHNDISETERRLRQDSTDKIGALENAALHQLASNIQLRKSITMAVAIGILNLVGILGLLYLQISPLTQ